MAPTTPAKLLHEGLVGILTDANLAVGDREVLVLDNLPEEKFTQRQLPMVVVKRPELDEEGPWGRSHVRRVYTVTFALLDSRGVKFGDEDEASERLELLLDKIKGEFALNANRNLQVAHLHVFYSLCSWTEGERVTVGNNLRLLPAMLEVPMILERGKVFDPDDWVDGIPSGD